MALSIISSTHQARRPDGQLPSDIEKTEKVDCDVYSGPPTSLIAARIVRPNQLPEPGKISIAYFQGQVIARKCKRDETFLRIEMLRDGMARVFVGVPRSVAEVRQAAEKVAREARRAAYVEEQREAEKRASMKDPGIDAARAAMLDSPARFEVGEACLTDEGELMEVVGKYDLYKVRDENGSFYDPDGNLCSYLFGYLVKAPGHKQFFSLAGDLFDTNANMRHLRVVQSDDARSS